MDLDARVVERWRPSDKRPEVLEQRLLWQPDGAPSPLLVDLDSFFREVEGV